MSDDYWMSSTLAAAMLGLSRSQINRLAASGQLNAQKLGSAWMIKASEVDRFAKARRAS
jgi:excisionase family DNA binding protein